MNENYIDLKSEITRMLDSFDTKVGIAATLQWLDENPDQVPGRTMTVEQLRAAVDETYDEDMNAYEKAHALLTHLEFTILTPGPTNAELIDEAYEVWDRDPQDFTFGEYLVRLGWAKALGGGEPEAGHDRAWWIENANVNDAEDCEACDGDLCPVHRGMAVGIDLMTKKIAALGDNPELFVLIADPRPGTTVGDRS